jgi:hypothetical protein
VEGVPILNTRAVIALATLVLGLGACGSEPGSGPAHTFVARRAMASGSTLYVGGTFREPDNAAGNKLLGHEMLVVLDASEPARPSFVSETDMKLTRLFAAQGGKLLGVQHGFDEEAVDGKSQLPRQNLRLKIFGLMDPERPTLERSIEIPGSDGASVTTATVLDGQTVLISIGTGIEPADFPLTWVVRLDAAAGSEVAGSANVACRAPVRDGPTLWCFNAQGRGTGYVVGFALDAAGGLTETSRVVIDAFILPMAAGLASAGGPVIVADAMAGTFRMDRDGNGGPSLIGATMDFAGSEVDVLTAAASSGAVIVQTGSTINVMTPSAFVVASALDVPGEPYQDFAGGSSVVRLDAAAGTAAALDGLFAAALGDYGVLLLRLSGQTLEKVGGYYRHFGTDLVNEDNIREGNY